MSDDEDPGRRSSSEDGSSRESSPEIESIIATRQRRSNAGSKLKQLLDSAAPLEEDEDVDGIFAEVENDDDFEVADDSEQQEEGGESDEESADEEALENGGKSPRGSARAKRKRRQQDSDFDQDENMSSSGSSSEDEGEDEDAAERELQLAAREEKRRAQAARKKKMFEIPAIKKRQREERRAVEGQDEAAVAAPKRAAKRSAVDLLVAQERRSSRRAAAVKNKEEVLERLKAEEVRKAKRPTQQTKVVQKKLTQAERLAEAEITERHNIASLNRYMDMEEERKQRQRAAMLARRVRMTNVLRHLSRSTLVPPEKVVIKTLIGGEDDNDPVKVEPESNGGAATDDKAVNGGTEQEKDANTEVGQEGRSEKDGEPDKNAPERNGGPDKGMPERSGEPPRDDKTEQDAEPTKDSKLDQDSGQVNNDSKSEQDGEPNKKSKPEQGGKPREPDGEPDKDRKSVEKDDESASEKGDNAAARTENAQENDKTEQKDADIVKGDEMDVDETASGPNKNENKELSNGDSPKRTDEAGDAGKPIESSPKPASEETSAQDPGKPDQGPVSAELDASNSEKPAGPQSVSKDMDGDVSMQEADGDKSTAKDMVKSEDADFIGPRTRSETAARSRESGPDDTSVDKESTAANGTSNAEAAPPNDAAKEDAEHKKEDKRKKKKPHFKIETFDVEGPPAKVEQSLVSLVEFPENTDYSPKVVCKTLLGPQATKMPDADRKRRSCCFTGLDARFVDPKTRIPYASLEAYRILKLVQSGALAWNVDMGGAYTGLRDTPRHASGVPSGFDD